MSEVFFKRGWHKPDETLGYERKEHQKPHKVSDHAVSVTHLFVEVIESMKLCRQHFNQMMPSVWPSSASVHCHLLLESMSRVHLTLQSFLFPLSADLKDELIRFKRSKFTVQFDLTDQLYSLLLELK